MCPRLALQHKSVSLCARCLVRRTLATSATSFTKPSPPPAPLPSGFAKLTNRRLLAVHGTDAPHFLHGITTASVRSGQTTGFFSSFLNAQGRVLNDVFIYPTSHSAAYRSSLSEKLATNVEVEAYFIEVDADQVDVLLRHLKRYKLRAKVDIRAVDSGEWSVWSAWNERDEPWTPHPHPSPTASLPPSSPTTIPTATPTAISSLLSPPSPATTTDTIGCTDARAPGMGRRLILPTSSSFPISPSTSLSAATTPAQDLPLTSYTIRRLLRGVPEGQYEIPREAALPQEYNIDFMGGIDFRKGCYVGQELTIRTHHTGVVRKRILPCLLYQGMSKENRPLLASQPQGDGELPERLVYDGSTDLAGFLESGTNIVPANKTGRPAGKWVGGVGNVGLGLCRVEMMTDMVLTADGGSRWSKEDEFKVLATVASGENGVNDASEQNDGLLTQSSNGKEVMIKAFVPDWVRNKTKIRSPQRRV